MLSKSEPSSSSHLETEKINKKHSTRKEYSLFSIVVGQVEYLWQAFAELVEDKLLHILFSVILIFSFFRLGHQAAGSCLHDVLWEIIEWRTGKAIKLEKSKPKHAYQSLFTLTGNIGFISGRHRFNLVGFWETDLVSSFMETSVLRSWLSSKFLHPTHLHLSEHTILAS